MNGAIAAALSKRGSRTHAIRTYPEPESPRLPVKSRFSIRINWPRKRRWRAARQPFHFHRASARGRVAGTQLVIVSPAFSHSWRQVSVHSVRRRRTSAVSIVSRSNFLVAMCGTAQNITARHDVILPPPVSPERSTSRARWTYASTPNVATRRNTSDFTLALGCVFVSILITGGTVITARLIMILIGLQ